MESNDIVTRLLDWALFSLDRGRVDAYKDFTTAADEIERLREQLRLANIDNFNTTAEIERLRDELVRNADEFRETLTELRQRVEALTAERDEARREVSYMRPSVTLGAQTAVSYAKSRRWDCFKEDGK